MPYSASDKTRWSQLAACCILCASAFAIPLPCFGVFVSPMVSYFGSAVTDVNLYFTFMTLAAVVSCLAGARLLTRHLRLTVAVAGLVMGLAYVALAVWPSVPMVWFVGVVAGLCYPLCSSVLVPIVINQWFDTRQGFYAGVAFALVGVAGMALGPVLASLIQSVGWRSTMGFTGAALGAVCVLVALALLRRHTSAVGAADAQASGDAGKGRAKVGGISGLGMSRVTLALVVGVSVLAGVLGVVNTQLSVVAQQSGLDAITAAFAFSCISGGLVAGKVMLGAIKDKAGAKAAITFGCAVGVVAFVLMGLAIANISAPLMFVSATLAGVATCLGTVMPALLCSEAAPSESYGQAVSLSTACCNAGMSIGAPVFSLIFDASGSYLPVAPLLAAVCIATALGVRRALNGSAAR